MDSPSMDSRHMARRPTVHPHTRSRIRPITDIRGNDRSVPVPRASRAATGSGDGRGAAHVRLVVSLSSPNQTRPRPARPIPGAALLGLGAPFPLQKPHDPARGPIAAWTLRTAVSHSEMDPYLGPTRIGAALTAMVALEALREVLTVADFGLLRERALRSATEVTPNRIYAWKKQPRERLFSSRAEIARRREEFILSPTRALVHQAAFPRPPCS